MSIKLKKLSDQVIVITGASSGIGLATAKAAAKQGAALVLASRSDQTLNDVAAQINGAGGRAVAVECDVANYDDVQRVAEEAIRHFGRIDTWVNNAGVAIYGRIDETGEEDARRLFDTDFWGVVHGSQVALPHLRAQGGALINLGSEVSEAAAALLGFYVAAKHAVKGFTDVLRMEIEEIDKAPVAITLIQPTATDTPFPQHARNLMDKEPKLPNPQIDPEDVAEAILGAATKHTRATKVGMMAKVNTGVSKVAPGFADKMGAKRAGDLKAEAPPRDPQGALHKSSDASEVSGQVRGTGPSKKAGTKKR